MKNYLYASLFTMALAIPAGASAQFAGGSGSSADPYQIATAAQLAEVTNFPTSSFIVTADIDLASYLAGSDWTPISTFTGEFDGNNKVISGLSIISGSDGVGFFARVNTPGIVKNVILSDAEVVANRWSGILVSTNGNWEKDGGTVENCKVINSYIEGNESIGGLIGVDEGNILGCSVINTTVYCAGDNAAGISGFVQSTKGRRIEGCTFSGEVNGTGEKVGGIAGFFWMYQMTDYPATIYNCAVYGTISGGNYVGGIAGYQQGVTTAIIDNNAVFANVTGGNAGGIVGAPADGTISNCYATGVVRGIEVSNGWSGGIVGASYNTVKDCYFSGSTTGGGYLGGIAGRNWPTITVANCYYNSDGSTLNMGEGQNTADFGAYPLLPEEMVSLSSFKFSDMSKWQIVEGESYPFFANQTAPITIKTCNENSIGGTYSGNVSEIVLSGSQTGGFEADIEFSNGTWTATLAEDAVLVGETVTAFGVANSLMPSMAAVAKVAEASAITTTTAGEIEVVSLDNAIRISLANGINSATYDIYAISGERVVSGVAADAVTVVALDGMTKGVYVVRVAATEQQIVAKVVLK